MNPYQTTCWTMIRGAADGRSEDRQAFAQHYSPVIRAYLAARWRSSPLVQELDDAVQEVFVECYQQEGVLARAGSDRPNGFRAFLYGVVRNVALRAESRRARRRDRPAGTTLNASILDSQDDELPEVFDRAWAQAVVKQAVARQAELAANLGGDAVRRFEILRLRFDEGLPIREIAARWQVDAVEIHRQYARARREFKKSLLDVMTFHCPGSPAEAESECTRLLTLLA